MTYVYQLSEVRSRTAQARVSKPAGLLQRKCSSLFPDLKFIYLLTVIHATFASNIHTTQHSLLWDLKREKPSKSFHYYLLISFKFSNSMLILAKLNNSLLFALATGFEHIPVYSFILLYCPYRHPGG